jgi:hypothetical protein
METFWRRCATCKRGIGFETAYWVCSVSTCNRKGSSLVFCSMPCWDSHVPLMRHREAWAEEQRSPTREGWGADAAIRNAAQPASPPRPAREAPDGDSEESGGDDAAPMTLSTDVPREVLVIASKLKKYIRARSGMNTSDAVMEVLSARLRTLCDDAIVRAHEDGRRTVMERDF